MLGQFLEISVPTESPAAGLEYFTALGFTELEPIDVLAMPYAAVWDGQIAIGLYTAADDGPALSFVRPELASWLHAFRHAGFDVEYAHIAEDQFHRAGLVDPSGQRIVLNEARSFSPATWSPAAVQALGAYLEYSMPTQALTESVDYWQRLGLKTVDGGDTPDRWARLSGNGLSIGLYERGRFEPGPTFRASSFDARVAYLEALGHRPARRAAPGGGRAATLATPFGIAIHLIG